MFQQMKKRIKNQKGLTLIELLAVIVILAIVAAIAIPAIGNIISNSRDKAILAEASNILSGAKIAYTDNACNGTDCKDDKLQPYVDGLTLTANDYAAYDATTKAWTVYFSRFSETKTDKYKVTGTSITEVELNKLLKK